MHHRVSILLLGARCRGAQGRRCSPSRVAVALIWLSRVQVRGELLQHRRASDLVVAPLLHNQILQALELESVAALGRELNLQTVGLLADTQLATDFKLAFAIAAPGGKALRVAPAELALLGAHVRQSVPHHSAGAQWFVAIQIVDHAATSTLACIGQEAVAHLQPVQMHHLEITHVDSPVRVLRLRYKLHEVARTALVE